MTTDKIIIDFLLSEYFRPRGVEAEYVKFLQDFVVKYIEYTPISPSPQQTEIVKCECGREFPMEFASLTDDMQTTCPVCQISYLQELLEAKPKPQQIREVTDEEINQVFYEFCDLKVGVGENWEAPAISSGRFITAVRSLINKKSD